MITTALSRKTFNKCLEWFRIICTMISELDMLRELSVFPESIYWQVLATKADWFNVTTMASTNLDQCVYFTSRDVTCQERTGICPMLAASGLYRSASGISWHPTGCQYVPSVSSMSFSSRFTYQESPTQQVCLAVWPVRWPFFTIWNNRF